MFQNPTEYIRTSLFKQFTSGEIRVFTTLILEEVCNMSISDIVGCKFNDLSDKEKQIIICIVKRLQNNEPIQYILGKSSFYGLDFHVTSSVLIPRPETEELVEWILQDYQNDSPHILDIGTGSGCIAVTLAKKINRAFVDAWDVSGDALEVANQNAKQHSVSIQFSKVDVLKPIVLHQMYDVIVSNPPYIKESEKESMELNVVGFEPHEALFVDNSEPLIFYIRIAEIANKYLNSGGKLYFEINQSKGDEVVDMLKKSRFINVELRKDISGNSRMVRAMKQ